jgi:signal transduction histidine kinase
MTVGNGNVAAGARRWLGRADGIEGWSTPAQRRLGVLWAGFTLVCTTAVSTQVHTRTQYLVAVILLCFLVSLLPGIWACGRAVRHAPALHRPSYVVLYAAMIATLVGGSGLLVWVFTGWGWVQWVAFPIAAAICGTYLCGMAMIVRRCSGNRALSVDIVEIVAAVVAVMAPLMVLWLPTVLGAEDRTFALIAATVVVTTLACSYWVAMQWARRGLEGGPMLAAASAAATVIGSAAGALNVAEGVTGYTLQATPAIGLTALATTAYLLIPLYAPTNMPEGLNRLAPQAQVRGGWLPIVVPLVGLVALAVATIVSADEHPWAVPFAFAVVLVLSLLAGLRQIAALSETRRLYRQVEASAEERHLLLAQLLARSVDDRRNVASHLHQQAVAAYMSVTSFAAATGRSQQGVAGTSAIIGGDLKDRAESLRELMQSLRPLDQEPRPGVGLLASIRAYVDTLYGDTPTPELTVALPDDLTVDWVVESVLLQIVQEALLNIHHHSRATAVEITVTAEPPVFELRITDNGRGFDPAAMVPAIGIATMQAVAGVLDGRVTIESEPGAGTTVVARLGAPPNDPAPTQEAPAPGTSPRLRLVPPAS